MDDGEALPASPDYGEDDSQRKTSVIEQCLAWGGEQRLRLLLTISVGGVLHLCWLSFDKHCVCSVIW